MDKDCLIYISGPMTGLPEENYPAFFEAEKVLKRVGFTRIYNPADITKKDSWQEYMDIHLPIVRRSTYQALLPRWGESKGARLEVEEAHKYGVKVDLIQNYLDLDFKEIESIMLRLTPLLGKENPHADKVRHCRESALGQAQSRREERGKIWNNPERITPIEFNHEILGEPWDDKNA